MVKAVVVLNSSEGVSGTVHFTQEGDVQLQLLEASLGLNLDLMVFTSMLLVIQRMVAWQLDHILILLANCMVLLRMRIAMPVTLATSQLVQMALHVSPLLTNRSLSVAQIPSLEGLLLSMETLMIWERVAMNSAQVLEMLVEGLPVVSLACRVD
ncbi:Superoxide dismutase [Cu-Zn] 2 [Camellia lanceoleosa]|uniref:Superoxide dismutase [Cu-Zn] 2 n=1 Tax=Camellia lanceoleosa TaxID=1840588 RepID=A0ACC0GDN1_9ERIC|nr:Superoxide dismutase [Cu-Zn] 2 [Camellia lanceoleosa]